MNKKIKVIEIDKKNKEIILEQKKSSFFHIFRKSNNHLLIILLSIALLFLLTSSFIFIKNIKPIDKPNYKFVSIDTSLKDYNEIIIENNVPLTDETAKNNFFKTGFFSTQGEVFLEEEYIQEHYTIKFYSDGMAIKIVSGSVITKISPLKDGNYGIDKNGTIKNGAHIRDISITSKKKCPWGEVTYYSDNSAEIVSKGITLYVRNAKDIKDKYISENKISYIKQTKENGKYKINYYYDGTIEIIDENKSYLIRDEQDFKIAKNSIIFPNNNQSVIYKTIKLKDGKIVNFYTDGGAIIIENGIKISIRKSNSIKILNNKIYEIDDNVYVEVSNKKNNIIYYTNGGAYFIHENRKYYIEENANLIYKDNKLEIRSKYELLSKETYLENESLKLFEKNAILEKNSLISIIPKDTILFDKYGKVIEFNNKENNKNNLFTITNNTNTSLKYRVIIEESKKTDLNSEYIKYQMQVKEEYYAPKKLNYNIWQIDAMSKSLNLKGKNYILIEDTIESGEIIDINLMLWTDYEKIPNEMQNKHFYGTIKVYAWLDK